MPALLHGQENWGLRRTEEGHREYFIKWLVEVNNYEDGPFVAMNTPGLPMVGSFWNFGNDVDPFAYCQPEWTVEPVVKKERGIFWTVEQPFSTKPRKRCADSQVENPLSEPMRVGGTFTKLTKQATHDRFGKLLITTSHELIKGQDTEFDDNRPNVTIGINLATLPLVIFAPMVDTVNDADLWGLPRRTVKLSNVRWQRLVYGTCSYYYTVDYEFDISYNTFDKPIANYGTKVLKGWAPGDDAGDQLDPLGIDPETGDFNYRNPKNFVVLKDVNGENMSIALDIHGKPVAHENNILVKVLEYYPESNMNLLGVPALL